MSNQNSIAAVNLEAAIERLKGTMPIPQTASVEMMRHPLRMSRFT
jgi:hypothetical protein